MDLLSFSDFLIFLFNNEPIATKTRKFLGCAVDEILFSFELSKFYDHFQKVKYLKEFPSVILQIDQSVINM